MSLNLQHRFEAAGSSGPSVVGRGKKLNLYSFSFAQEFLPWNFTELDSWTDDTGKKVTFWEGNKERYKACAMVSRSIFFFCYA